MRRRFFSTWFRQLVGYTTEVGAEPALCEAELRPHRADEDEPTEHTGRLCKRKDRDDEGTNGCARMVIRGTRRRDSALLICSPHRPLRR